MVSLREAVSPADVAEVRVLFAEYAQSLGIDLSFQDFEQELTALPGAYVRPGGLLLLAEIDRPVGCIAVRPFESGACEMKRLYVRDEARGHGVGRALASAAIDFGRAAGYDVMRLDTLPMMETAQALYRELGFRAVAPYRYNPVAGTTFMELSLRPRD